jgi:UPF0716 protein FxsA
MVGLLRVLVVIWPLAEILVLIVVGDAIGAGWTVLALVGAGLLGIAVIRILGAASLRELQGALLRQEPPTGALVRGACVLLAGMLLIVPGFLSDAVALLLLIPPLRTALAGAVWRRWPRTEPVGPGARGQRPMGPGQRGGGPVIIDGDYREVPPEPPHSEPPEQLRPPPPPATPGAS